MDAALEPKHRAAWRERTWRIIFLTDTWAGRAFDVGLLWAIVVSVVAVMLESVAAIRSDWGDGLRLLEWAFTLLFTLEYGLRLVCVRTPIRYATSFFGLVDLMAILPTYLSLVLPGSQSLLVIRALRLLRVFRVLKLMRFLGEANVLVASLRSSVPKVIVFLGTILVLVLIMGTAMYLIEGEQNGFTSVPRSMYWAVVTMTTVGYGDIAPQTVLGQVVAAAAMIMGYSIIAVPTGIVSAEIVRHGRGEATLRTCATCGNRRHDADARYCNLCGATLGE